MVVMILENGPPALRGELSRWLVEPHAGVFVGSVSAMVRDKLWEKVIKGFPKGGAALIYNSNSEQGFVIVTHGPTRRKVEDCEGLLFIANPRHSTDTGEQAKHLTTGEDGDD